MTDEETPRRPRLSEDGTARAADRFARQAEALRANLRRRKARERQRQAATDPPPSPGKLR